MLLSPVGADNQHLLIGFSSCWSPSEFSLTVSVTAVAEGVELKADAVFSALVACYRHLGWEVIKKYRYLGPLPYN